MIESDRLRSSQAKWFIQITGEKAVESNLGGFSLSHFSPQQPICFTGSPLVNDPKSLRLLTRANSTTVI
jgi:hypothetical protein